MINFGIINIIYPVCVSNISIYPSLWSSDMALTSGWDIYQYFFIFVNALSADMYQIMSFTMYYALLEY